MNDLLASGRTSWRKATTAYFHGAEKVASFTGDFSIRPPNDPRDRPKFCRITIRSNSIKKR
jgi:hypothetical protein